MVLSLFRRRLASGRPPLASRRPAPRRLTFDLLEDRVVPAGNLFLTQANEILEYTPAGSFVGVIDQIPYPGNDNPQIARDLIVGSDGLVHVFNGTTDPRISTYDGSWSHLANASWTISNVGSRGGIARYQDTVVATNEWINVADGLIAFDLASGTSQFFGSIDEYQDVTLGLDGYFHALTTSQSFFDRYDPATLNLLDWINVPGDVGGRTPDYRAGVANALGWGFFVDYNGFVDLVDTSDSVVATLDVGTSGLIDIDLDTDGTLILGTEFGQVVVTDENFSTLSSFDTGTGLPTFVGFKGAFTIPPKNITIGDVTVTEGTGSSVIASFTVTISSAASQVLTVDYATEDGTALAGQDYVAQSGTLTFNPGETTKTINITVLGDALDELNEQFFVNLSNPSSNGKIVDDQGVGTIVDNDPAPTVSFALASSSGLENVASPTLTVNLSAASGLSVTVKYKLNGGTATQGSDFTFTSGTLTFNPGETSKTVPLTILNDGFDEPNETVVVNLFGPTNATLGAITDHTYTILDDDPTPTLAFAQGSSTAAETAGVLSIPVTLTGLSFQTITVNYAVTGGTATAGQDYTFAAGTLTFLSGESSKTINLTVLDDLFDEPNETVVITLSGPTNAVLGAPASHTLTINDDEPTPQVGFRTTAAGGDESVTPVTVEVFLTNASAQTVTVNYAQTGGSATAGADFTFVGGTLTFGPGELSKTFSFGVVNDAEIELFETVQFGLSGPTNAVLGANTSFTYTIEDNDPPNIYFEQTASSGSEASANPSFDVVLSAPTGRTVICYYAVTGGSAANGQDYNLANGFLTFNPGETRKSIQMGVVNDNFKESNETVEVMIAVPLNAALVTSPRHTYTILDNDVLPGVAFATAASSVGEGARSTTLTVDLTAPSAQAVTVQYALTGGTATLNKDFKFTGGTLVFAPGQTSKTVVLTVLNDTLYEGPETVQVTLSNPTNALLGFIPTQTVTIVDNEPAPRVGFKSNRVNVSEGATTGKIAVSLSGKSSQPVTVNYTVIAGTAERGTDFTLADGTLTFNPGETTKSISFTPVHDKTDEDDETFQVRLTGPVGAVLGTDLTTVTLKDDDLPPNVSFLLDRSALFEGGLSTQIEVILSQASSKPIQVGVAATGGTATGNGTDFKLPSPNLFFAPGETRKFLTVDVINDKIFEGDETVILSLVNPSNAKLGSLASYTLTILDDD
jgi:hypothetical protein